MVDAEVGKGWARHVSWALFLVFYIVAWNKSILATLLRYQSDTAPGSHAVVRRAYLFTLCSYAVASTWLNVAYMLLMVMLLLHILNLIFEYVEYRDVVLPYLVPQQLLQCIGPQTVGMHAVAALATLFFCYVIVGFYVKDSDLQEGESVAGLPPTLIGKVARSLYVPAAVVAAAYVVLIIV